MFTLREKCPNTEFFSGPYFPAFGLNTDRYGVSLCNGVSLRIQSNCGKIRTRKNSLSEHFSRSVSVVFRQQFVPQRDPVLVKIMKSDMPS